MTILIAEDNRIAARIVEIVLQKHGYETVLAPTGAEALACLGARSDIHLVVSDIMMPDLDGLELLASMKEHPQWQYIPVIMCTALPQAGTVKQAIALGCAHYVLKPIQADHLLSKVRQVLEDESPVLKDQLRTISELGLDLKSYHEIIRTFANQLRAGIQLLELELDAGAPATLPESLADLAEGAGLLGAERTKSLLDRLATGSEEMGQDERDVQFRLLSVELKRLHQALPCPPHVAP